MTRVAKPHFGSRHHRPTPQWHLGDPPKGKRAQHQRADFGAKPVWNLGDPPRERRRIDWALIALIVAVFVAGFVWIIPAVQQ